MVICNPASQYFEEMMKLTRHGEIPEKAMKVHDESGFTLVMR